MEYFMDKLQEWELNDLMAMIQYSNRHEWEQTRTLAWILAQTHSSKQLKRTDVLPLPWDEEQHDYSISKKEIERLQHKANMISEKYNNKTE